MVPIDPSVHTFGGIGEAGTPAANSSTENRIDSSRLSSP